MKWVNTRGLASLAVAICDRCSVKMPIVDLAPDPNAPGLRVCDECRDLLDPYRLPARKTESTVVRNPRVDARLINDPAYWFPDEVFSVLETDQNYPIELDDGGPVEVDP